MSSRALSRSMVQLVPVFFHPGNSIFFLSLATNFTTQMLLSGVIEAYSLPEYESKMALPRLIWSHQLGEAGRFPAPKVTGVHREFSMSF